MSANEKAPPVFTPGGLIHEYELVQILIVCSHVFVLLLRLLVPKIEVPKTYKDISITRLFLVPCVLTFPVDNCVVYNVCD